MAQMLLNFTHFFFFYLNSIYCFFVFRSMTLFFNFSKYFQIYMKSTFECGGRKFNSGSNTEYVNLLLFTHLFLYFLRFVFILVNMYTIC